MGIITRQNILAKHDYYSKGWFLGYVDWVEMSVMEVWNNNWSENRWTPLSWSVKELKHKLRSFSKGVKKLYPTEKDLSSRLLGVQVCDSKVLHSCNSKTNSG